MRCKNTWYAKDGYPCMENIGNSFGKCSMWSETFDKCTGIYLSFQAIGPESIFFVREDILLRWCPAALISHLHSDQR